MYTLYFNQENDVLPLVMIWLAEQMTAQPSATGGNSIELKAPTENGYTFTRWTTVDADDEEVNFWFTYTING